MYNLFCVVFQYYILLPHSHVHRHRNVHAETVISFIHSFIHEGIRSSSYLVLQHTDCLQRPTMSRKTERSSCLFYSLPKGLLTRKANEQKQEISMENIFFPFVVDEEVYVLVVVPQERLGSSEVHTKGFYLIHGQLWPLPLPFWERLKPITLRFCVWTPSFKNSFPFCHAWLSVYI